MAGHFSGGTQPSRWWIPRAGHVTNRQGLRMLPSVGTGRPGCGGKTGRSFSSTGRRSFLTRKTWAADGAKERSGWWRICWRRAAPRFDPGTLPANPADPSHSAPVGLGGGPAMRRKYLPPPNTPAPEPLPRHFLRRFSNIAHAFVVGGLLVFRNISTRLRNLDEDFHCNCFMGAGRP